MRPCTTSIEQFLKDTIDIKYYELDYDVPKSESKFYVKATKEQFDEFFNKYDALVYEYPNDMVVYGQVKFYFKKNPKRVMKAFVDAFYRNPNNSFSKVRNITAEGPVEDKAKKHEEERQKKEDALRESMKAEGCELISKYTNANADVFYLFEGFEYKTRPTKWNAGHRPHKAKCIRYTPNYVRKVFKDAGCILLTEYKNQKTKLRYLYEGKEYEVYFNDWLYYGSRPHLGIKRSFFTET